MKLLTISNLYHPYIIGGAEIVAQRIAEGMRKFGFSSVVITIAPEEKIEEVNGVKVYYVTKKNLYHFFPKRPRRPWPIRFMWHLLDLYNPWMGQVVGRILDAERPDLVHTHNIVGFSGAVWKAAKRRGLPLVHTIHDHYLLCPNSVMFKARDNCRKPCLTCLPFHYVRRKLSDQVDYVVAVSAFVMARHRQFGFFNRARQGIIHNAAMPHDFNVQTQGAKPSALRLYRSVDGSQRSGAAPWMSLGACPQMGPPLPWRAPGIRPMSALCGKDSPAPGWNFWALFPRRNSIAALMS